MMPIVFWASLPPWPSEYSPAETSCARRNRLSTFSGDVRRNSQATPTISIEPRAKPISGETKMKATVFSTPAAISGWAPALARVAPTMPPMSACELDDGMPYHQVTAFQKMAPIERAEDDVLVHHAGLDDALAHRGRHAEVEDEDRHHVEEGGEGHRLAGLEHAGGNDRGDRVGRVVEAVHEVEGQGQDDQ